MCEEIIFEDIIINTNCSKTNRRRKFMELLYMRQLPWDLVQTLNDWFPMVEQYFYDSDRINFINLSQLAIEMLGLLGREEYCDRFKSLKTKARCNDIKQFVIASMNHGKPAIDLTDLRDLEYIELKLDYEPDMSKVSNINHIYSDKSNIANAKKSVKKEKDTTKTETKGRVLLKLRPRKDLRGEEGKVNNKN